MKQARLVNYLEPRLAYSQGRVYPREAWRKKVMLRDGFSCKSCLNMVRDEFRSRKPANEVHHIIPRRHGGCNTLNNGITLCTFCHDWFDHRMARDGLDYFQILKDMNMAERIDKVKWLMRKRYHAHLLNRMLYSEV
jgi:predicted restriction endonuclease